MKLKISNVIKIRPQAVFFSESQLSNLCVCGVSIYIYICVCICIFLSICLTVYLSIYVSPFKHLLGIPKLHFPNLTLEFPP